MPLPLVVLLIPVLAAAAIGLGPSYAPWLRAWRAAGCLLPLPLALAAYVTATTPGFGPLAKLPWLTQPWPVALTLRSDGFSLGLLVLTTIFGAAAAWWLPPGAAPRSQSAAWLVMQASTGAVFLAGDAITFYIVWEVMLLASYLLIAGGGGAKAHAAATRYLLYNLVGSLGMLVGLVAIGLSSCSFDFAVWAKHPSAPAWALLPLLFGLAVKAPLFPFHGWMADTYAAAPAAVAAFLAAAQGKAGLYALVRLALPVFPQLAWLWPTLTGLLLAGLIYGAFLAVAQREARRVLAYASLSHLSLITLGLLASPLGQRGAALQMVGHGLYTGALFLLLGSVEARGGGPLLGDLKHVATRFPRLGGAILLAGLAALGLPGLAGFSGELTILLGLFQRGPWVALVATVTVILAAVYMIHLIQRTLHATDERPPRMSGPDLQRGQLALITLLVAGLIGLGWQPQVVLDRSQPPAAAMLHLTVGEGTH